MLTRTSQQIDGSFGTAVLAVILEDAIVSHHGALAGAFDIAFWWSAGFSAVAVLLSLAAGRPASPNPRRRPGPSARAGRRPGTDLADEPPESTRCVPPVRDGTGGRRYGGYTSMTTGMIMGRRR